MTQPDLAQTALDEGPAPVAPSAEALRKQMVKELIEEGELDDPAIQSAFRAVPRDVFAPPGTPTELPYAVHDALRTRFSDDGRALSSLSAPYMLLRTSATAADRGGASAGDAWRQLVNMCGT
jgi:protein-L-isoaspartate(D-aspartate) O-methyltransferase